MAEQPDDSPFLQVIDRTVCSFIKNGTHFGFNRKTGFLELAILSRKCPFELLSAGFQRVISMALDLAWRACVLNPHLGLQATRYTGGVLLLDGPELHLEPFWRYQLVRDLMAAFPSLQLVVTNHDANDFVSHSFGHIRRLSSSGRLVGPFTEEELED